MATEAERQARDEQLEAILGLKMLHPNIVRTFQFATKDRSVSFFLCPDLLLANILESLAIYGLLSLQIENCVVLLTTTSDLSSPIEFGEKERG